MMEDDNIGDTMGSDDAGKENSTGRVINPRVIMEQRVRAKYPDEGMCELTEFECLAHTCVALLV